MNIFVPNICIYIRSNHIFYLFYLLTFSENYCNVLPNPVKPGAGYEKGCKGARYGNNGSPSVGWCKGDHGRYPWYEKCCDWKSNDCVSKGVLIILIILR